MHRKALKEAKDSSHSVYKKIYLISYNAIQTVGWTYMLFQTLIYFLNRGTLDAYWNEVKWTVLIFQNAAILEVLHAAIGLVPSSVMVTIAQVYSRVFLVLGVLLVSHSATVSPGLPICLIAWSFAEIIRYSYYTMNLVNLVPHLLLIIRYSGFFVLYPVGITGELLCMYYSLDEVAEKQLLTISLPNPWNFIFNYHYFLIFYMLLYIPCFPILYSHMVSQRKKVLSKEAKHTK